MLLFLLHHAAAATDLPVRFLNGADAKKPLIFYITGDGGWNSFSTSLLQSLNQQGFAVAGLDAKNYFWNRKTPEQAAHDIAGLLLRYSNIWSQRGLVFIGYSFGADVMPFIQARLPKNILQHLKTTVLLSPSEGTDFEVHLLDILSDRGRFRVREEINKLTSPVTLLFGAGEKPDDANILSKNVHIITLAGGHHYNNDTKTLTATLMRSMGF